MKDKEKQIEEMANGLEEKFGLCGTLSSCGTLRCSQCFSKYLYNQGYRKIDDKDSVMLSREEYEILKIKEKEKHWLETCMSVWENGKIDGSKKTAEKILNKVYSKLTEPSTWKQMHTWWLYNGECEQLKALLNEIAISEGIEIKE